MKDSGHMERAEKLQRPLLWHGRSYRRFKLEFPVHLKYQNASRTIEIETISTNLSLGGLLVRSTLPVPQTTAVTFVLSLHGSESARPIRLVGEGEVVRVEGGDVEGTYLMAVKCGTPVTELQDYLPI